MCIRDRNSDLKNDINEINKNVEKTNEIFASKFNELERNIEKMGEWRTDIGKCKINENNEDISVNSNGVSLNAKQVAVDKVSNNDNYNNELTSDNNDIIKNGDVIENVVSE